MPTVLDPKTVEAAEMLKSLAPGIEISEQDLLNSEDVEERFFTPLNGGCGLGSIAVNPQICFCNVPGPSVACI